MGVETTIAATAAHAFEDLQLFGEGAKARELSEIVKEHALLGTAAALIPVPGADLAALAANTWAMYVRINKAVGVSFGEHVLKSIASGVIANVAALVPGIAVAAGVETILKFIPGIGTVGGIAVGVAANVAITYVAGKVYLKSLEKLVHSGKPLTEENIKMAATEVSKDKAFVKTAYAEGKEVAKSQKDGGSTN